MIMTRICIHQLSILALLGTNPRERIKKQRLDIDISFEYDAPKAIRLDDLSYAVDYESLVKTIKNEVSRSRFFLAEALADFILSLIMKDPSIRRADVTIHKPKAIKGARGVSIRLYKERKA